MGDNHPNVQHRTMFTGDCLAVLRGFDDACIDLIYLDPPFNSKHNYAAPIGSKAAGAAFRDTWTLDDIDVAWIGMIADEHPDLHRVIEATHTKSDRAYLAYMAVRLIEMKRVLKLTGSIYLHCDPTMSAWLRIAMDAIFGKQNFRNEIVWKRTSSKSGTRKLAAVHDVILFYAASAKSTYNPVYIDHDPEYVRKFYRYEDAHGRYRNDNLTATGVRHGDSGQPWRGIDPSVKGNHWRAPGTFPDHVEKPARWNDMATREKLDFLDAAGLIYWPKKKGGVPAFKRYLSTSKGAVVTDMLLDIPPLSARAKEKVGYPTQKPLRLLERLISASSNPGDFVLDPFCGCATACVAAEKLGRKWIGIDLSPVAADLVRLRVDKELTDILSSMGPYRYEIIHRTDIPVQTSGVQRSPDIKHTLYGQQEGYCNGCRVHFPFRNMTIDHIIPIAKGGADTDSNLQLLCGACNSKKGKRSQEVLRAELVKEGILKGSESSVEK